MDIIFIRDLRVDTVIGIYDWERSIKQTLRFDLEMATDIARAAASDSIEDTLNYKAVAKRVIAFVEDSSFQLVETLAERVAELVREEPLEPEPVDRVVHRGVRVADPQVVVRVIDRHVLVQADVDPGYVADDVLASDEHRLGIEQLFEVSQLGERLGCREPSVGCLSGAVKSRYPCDR